MNNRTALSPRKRRSSRRRQRNLLLAAPVVLVTLVTVAWLLDRRSADDVARNVALAGHDIAGLDAAALVPVVDGVAERLAAGEVIVDTPDGPLRAGSADLGLTVDRDATLDAALETRPPDPLAWLRSWISPRPAPVIVTVDAQKVADLLAAEDPTDREPAVEPAVTGDGGDLAVRQGRPGRGLSAAAVAAAVVDASRSGAVPIRAAVEPGPLAPRFSREDAEALAARATKLTDAPLDIEASGRRVDVSVRTLRSWITSRPTLAGLELDLVDDAVLADLENLLEGVGEEPVDATVSIEGGAPVIVSGRDGTACCDPAAPARILDALVDGRTSPVSIPLTARPPRRTTDEVRALGIVEQIGSFTTKFPGGQSRVVNIHRIADLVDGTIIGPGGRFSVNDKVGARTVEKGFVMGGVIQDGVFGESIGGGISQFATTLFNAAFFGGLDFEEYQSHSIYISRYPYGREATLSFPKPDLVIENSTPHGVLIDTSHSGTSVTVTLWSTRHATGEQSAQTETPAGNCKRVRTERTRRYVDGSVKVDAVSATYRPEEGVRC